MIEDQLDSNRPIQGERWLPESFNVPAAAWKVSPGSPPYFFLDVLQHRVRYTSPGGVDQLAFQNALWITKCFRTPSLQGENGTAIEPDLVIAVF